MLPTDVNDDGTGTWKPIIGRCFGATSFVPWECTGWTVISVGDNDNCDASTSTTSTTSSTTTTTTTSSSSTTTSSTSSTSSTTTSSSSISSTSTTVSIGQNCCYKITSGTTVEVSQRCSILGVLRSVFGIEIFCAPLIQSACLWDCTPTFSSDAVERGCCQANDFPNNVGTALLCAVSPQLTCQRNAACTWYDVCSNQNSLRAP